MIYRNDSSKNARALSGVCQTDFTIALCMNHYVFDTLYKEKVKREREAAAIFIHQNCIGFSEVYTLNKIIQNVTYLFT